VTSLSSTVSTTNETVNSLSSGLSTTNASVSTEGTDLVNVNQLNEAVAQSNSYMDSMAGAIQGQVSGVARSAYSGIAAASAMAMIPNIDQDKMFSVGVGGATYQGYAAGALAVNVRVTNNLVMKAGASKANGGTVYGANASYRW
jgi:trimeric autotransporter adhesin